MYCRYLQTYRRTSQLRLVSKWISKSNRLMSTYHFVIWLSRSVAKVLFRFRILHRERMIETGPVILAMNHQSYLDPTLEGSVSNRVIFSLASKSVVDTSFWEWLLPKLNIISID